MTDLDIALHDEAKRITAREGEPYCTLDRCVCPTCATAEILLRVQLQRGGAFTEDTRRVTIRANDFAGGAYPYVASVRVDGVEVYRIHDRPDEVFEPEIMAEIKKALRRPM